MTRVPRWLAFVAIGLAGAAFLAPTASAAKGPRLVEAGRAKFPDRAFVLTLPSKRVLTESDVQVLENGERVSEVSLAAIGSAASGSSAVVLVIDSSRSMRGKAIKRAFAAARSFAARRPPNQRIAIVGFNRRATVLLPLTDDADAIEDALSKTPALAEGTRIYDGVAAGLSLLDDSDASLGTIVVLSDGADTGSAVSGSDAAVAARRAGVRVFTVGIRSAHFTAEPLRSLARRTSGGFVTVRSTRDLAGIYGALGSRLANEYTLRYRSNAHENESVRVAVRVKGTPGLAVAAYNAPAAGEFASDTYQPSVAARIIQSPLTMLFVALLVAGLVGLAMLSVLRPRRRTLRARMAEFVSIRPSHGEGDEQDRIASRVLIGAERSLETTKWWGRFKETLELAEIRMSPAKIALLTALATLLVTLFFALAVSPLFALAGLGVPLGVRSIILRKLQRRRKQFSEQLPDNLQVLASALRAGHSFVGALSVVEDDADEPSKTEFRGIVRDEQLGVPLEEAIRSVVKRMDNEDLEQVALVAALQRRTGGNMAEVLERVTETIRERFELRRMVQTLTAQGRMSRWIVSALPVALLLAVSAINPTYVAPLFESTGGRLMLTVAAAMVITGSLVIKRIVNIKV